MFKTWFDERFWSVTARDHGQWRIRIGATVAVGVLLSTAADWRPALAWLVGALALEAPLWRLTCPVPDDAPVRRLHAVTVLFLQALLSAAWGFAGVILWGAGGLAGLPAAMAFFAALLFYVVAQRGGSPALAVAAAPILVAPLVAPLVVPAGGLLEQAMILVLTGLAVGQAGHLLLKALPAPRAPADVRPTAPPPKPVRAVEGHDLSFEALAEAKAEAEAANQAKSAFLAIMSHEIRTPLNGMLGMTQALARDPSLNSSQRQRLTVIRQSGESLLSILNDILDLSKVEAGKLELEQIEFDIGDLARSAHESFTALATQKGLKCRLVVEPDAQGAYLGDPTRVRQILYNLISNALKFTHDGEISVAVASAGKDGLRLTVSDSGVGIESHQLERLFQKFEQADASSTRRYGGTGLGLAICRDLCELMGGDIAVESEVGRGARFIVTLPLQRATGRNPAAVAPRAAEQAMPNVASLRVLAAEDNPTNQMVLKALLAPVGIEPTVVDDGAQAVQAWSVGEFDLILMDIQMPRMDGLGAARAIRAEEARSGRCRTPIIALTANAMAHQVEEYFAAGMDGHVPKPIDLATLYAAIEGSQARPVERGSTESGLANRQP